ncbi:MAG: hypothetical protein CVU18_07870 [Betaproteobacteria bacterium HGW-Betaproteobacteria-12]|nr:MAG: hypothetical protein CVU18_07870 [Betaproteobacteria bacterium HGW-Betaproteobacteria-12]
MNGLTPRERELVALGAAMGSNCVPCIEHHIPEARRAGLSDAELGEAIELADQIRQVPARKVLAAASAALAPAAARAPLPEAAQCADMSRHASSCC